MSINSRSGDPKAPDSTHKASVAEETRRVLADNLKQIMTFLRLETRDLHNRCTYSIPFLTGLLKGAQNPSVDALYVVAESLAVTSHELLDPRFSVPEDTLLAKMLSNSNDDIEAKRLQVKKEGAPTRRFIAAHMGRLMRMKGITTSGLYEETHIAVSTLNKALKGQQNITVDTLSSIASSLGVSTFVLLLPSDD